MSDLAAAILISAALYADNTYQGCRAYPCAHYGHIVSGAAVSSVASKLYGEKTGWVAGVAFSVGSEAIGSLRGRAWHNKDVLGRGIGAAGGLWLYRQF